MIDGLTPPSWISAPATIILRGEVVGLKGDLPPTPAARSGRTVRWVAVTVEPGFDYGGKFYKVNGKWIKDQIQAYEMLTDGEYTAPVRREHKPEGVRFGDVLSLSSREVEGKGQLIAAVEFSDRINGLIESGEVKYFSPGFSSIRDERGREFPMVLTEISVVSAPHQKGMGATHVLSGENAMSFSAEQAQELLEMLSEYKAALAELEEDEEKEPEEKEKEPEEKEKEPAEKEKEPAEKDEDPDRGMAELKATLAELKADRERLRVALEAETFDRKFPVGASVSLTEANKANWFKLAQLDETLFRSLVSGATDKKEQRALPVVRDYFDGITLGSTAQENGQGGNTRTQTDLSAEVERRKLEGVEGEITILREWANEGITLVEG
jgi:hypothetical protein